MEAKKIAQNCLADYPKLQGSAAVQILLDNPDSPLEPLNLAYALKHREQPISLGNSTISSAPIPFTDEKTLHAVNKRLNALIARQAESPHPATEAEIKALISYRRQCVRPGGAIRNFPDARSKASLMVRAAITRLLEQAAKDGHTEAVAYIKAHLKMGKIFRWEP